MRSVWSLFAIGAVASAVNQHGGEVGVPLKNVLGSIEEVKDFSRWADSDRGMSKTGNLNPRPSLYHELRHPDHCVFPLDIVILQDLTDSFNDNIEEMRNVQLKRMVDGLARSHPESRFAVVGFQDKPIWKMGDRDDACWLFAEDFTSNLESIFESYSKFTCYGGADAPENQFGAISAALYTKNLHWAPNNSERSKLLVVVTDAGPHHADDGVTPEDGTILKPWLGPYSDENAEDLCLRTGYPSAPEIHNQIVANQAYMAFLVFDGDWANGWAANEWQTFNRFIGQPDEFVRQDTGNSSMFWEHLSHIIAKIEKVECAPHPPVPTDIPTTTDATTSTTTTSAADTTTTTTTTTASVTTAGATETTTTTTATTTTATTTEAPTTATTTFATTTEAPTTAATTTTTTEASTTATTTTTTEAPTTATTTTASVTTAGATETTTSAAATSTVVESAVGPPVSYYTETLGSTAITAVGPPPPPPMTTGGNPPPPPPMTTGGNLPPQPHHPEECQPTIITPGDGACEPSPENCWCQTDIIIKLAIRPSKMNLLADKELAATW